MRRNIIIILGIYALLIILGAVGTLHTIRMAMTNIDTLLKLHQVEILREHFLIQISNVQRDLALRDTPYSRSFDATVVNVRKMDSILNTCFSCHHDEPTLEQLIQLKLQAESYKDSLSRVLTVRAGQSRLVAEQNQALRTGEILIERMEGIVTSSSLKLEERTQEAWDRIAAARQILYWLMAAGFLVPIGLAIILVTGLSKPLNILLNATRSLKRGDLDHRVTGLKDEFGELADAFNDMAASLKEQMLKMQRTEQMAVAGELSAGLAHEIKNPLAGIKVAMEVLSNEAGLSEEDLAVVNQVGQEITRLESLMHRFLSFARPAKPRLEEVNINNLLYTTLAVYVRNRRRSAEKEPEFTVVKEFGELPLIEADPMQLQQVFVNLVLNSIDAMDQGGTLKVRTSADNEQGLISIDISDTGAGIEATVLEQIFKPFFTTKHQGTGLGLAVTNQLIEQHGGTISVRSTPGDGTTFSITLPY